MRTQNATWSVAEAFLKFGFDDGDDPQHNIEVADALDAHGYDTVQVSTIHNNWIHEVRGPGIPDRLLFDGYWLPPYDDLPVEFKLALLDVDPDLTAEEWNTEGMETP